MATPTEQVYLGIDLGTGGVKAAVVARDGSVLGTASSPCVMRHPHSGWAEQNPEDYWTASCEVAKDAIAQADIDPEHVKGLAFAGQMLTLVPVDATGRPTRPAISWLDSRADAEAMRITRRMGGRAMVRSFAGAVPSGKDVIAKVSWIRSHEPDVYAHTEAFLDATGYLVARATGELLIDHSGVSGTGIINRRTRGWSRPLALLGGWPLRKMPSVRRSVDVAGSLRRDAAEDLGLRPGVPVVMGMGDAAAAEVGTGALGEGDAHVYLGTSGWLGVHLSRPRHLGRSGIVSIASADPTSWLLIAETQTAGATVDWFLGAVGLGPAEPDDDGNRYDALSRLVERSPSGARGVLFAPWLTGERAPVTDTALRGAFVGLGLDHDRSDLARAVLEGVAINMRWSADEIRAAGIPLDVLRAAGGGARSDVWLQIIADVLGARIERVRRPQDSGAVGCALTVAVALGDLPSMAALRNVVHVEETFTPQAEHRATYDRLAHALRRIQPALSGVARI